MDACDEQGCSADAVDGKHAALPTAVVNQFLERWMVRDVEACLALLSPDATYTLHIEETLLPFAGTTTGRDQVGQQLRAMLRDWDYLVFRPAPAKQHVGSPNLVNSRVEFIFRHKASGEKLDGFMRMALTVEDGLISAIDQYHDTALVEAFLRLIAAQQD